MAKTPGETLLGDIADDFHTYLRHGVRVDGVIGDAHPDLDIDDLDSLLRVHFVLTEADDGTEAVGVVDFIRALEAELRQLKTSTARQQRTFRGEVRGRVDWQATTKERSRAGRPEQRLFVCRTPEVEYEIDENLVLKRLLSVIRDIVTEELAPAMDDRDKNRWLGDWVTPTENGRTVAEMLQRAYEENIYLQRIGVERQDVTERMLEDVKRSRSPLYRDAAILLDRYRQLRDRRLSAEEVREVLNNTLIAPDETHVVFELYWVFQILNQYEDVTYLPLAGENRSKVARWRSEGHEYVLYHDATGEAVTFREDAAGATPSDDGFLLRLVAALERWGTLSEELFDRRGTESLWGGRPDILIERFEMEGDERRLDEVFIGEVKYTRDTGYAARGLRELLEYMALVKYDNEEGRYVEPEESILESDSVQGMLFVDGVDTAEPENEDIRVLSYGDSCPRPL